MAERTKASVLKTGRPGDGSRGFESHSLRGQNFKMRDATVPGPLYAFIAHIEIGITQRAYSR